jgi:predicted dehydrogenase
MTRLSRRRFLSTSAAATSALALGAYVNVSPARESKSPNGKLNIAGIGVTGRGGEDIAGVASENVVVLCDVDLNLLEKGMARFKAERKYNDFRIMLEKEEKNIDAVVVGTPDHTHAPAAAMALRLGKHVYCEKPLTHTVKEARVLATLAKEKKLVTQMGNQIHAGDNYRRVVELVQSGAIGKVSDVHVWAGAQYHSAKFTTGTTPPKGLDWDLWLGPAPERPYSEGVHPFNWRKFWDYGTGTLGDFGCHYMDLAHWALNLRAPTAVEATGDPTPYDHVSAPRYCIAHYEYPARGEVPACRLHWYDSGKQPALWATLENEDAKKATAGGGQLFVGDGGMLLSNYGSRWLLPESKFAGFKAPKETIPASIGHHQEWINAVKTGGTTTCNFDYAGALTEAVLLGTVAYRSGKRVEWDAANLKVTNNPDAQQFVHTEYRKGWTL